MLNGRERQGEQGRKNKSRPVALAIAAAARASRTHLNIYVVSLYMSLYISIRTKFGDFIRDFSPKTSVRYSVQAELNWKT